MIYTGIDIWAKWGIVSINDKKEIVFMSWIPRCKERVKVKWKMKQKEIVNWFELRRMLSSLEWKIVIEDVHSIFWTSAWSNFNFWFIKWFKWACVCLKDSLMVTPKTWQKAVWDEDDIVYKKLTPRKVKDTKATSLKCAQRIFPWVDWKLWSQRSQQDWLYDSALMAYRLLLENS